MRRTFYCSFAAIFLAIAVHFFPLWTDSFIAVQKGDAYIKVFQCGWPFSYAVSDQLGDQPSTKIFSCSSTLPCWRWRSLRSIHLEFLVPKN